MPTAPPRSCPCGGKRIGDQPCDRCGRGGRRQETRSKAVLHFNNVTYGRKWKNFRLSFLAQHPLCADCAEQNRVTAATEVHHRVKVKDDPSRQYDEDNCLALCESHHSQRTSRGE